MKLLKSAFLLFFTMTSFIFFSFGQDSLKQSPAQESSKGARKSKEGSPEDFDSHMAKFQQSYNKMKLQEGKVKDPKLKVDMDAMLAKMSNVNNEYSAMKDNTKMSAQQQEQSRKRIQSDMKEVRKMHEEMKEKYPDQMGGKAKKSDQQTAPPKESEPYPN